LAAVGFEVKDVDLAGRIGVLRTRHGRVETPAFFPVIDVARQEVSVRDIKEAGFNQVITNAYLLFKRYGSLVVERGGVHRFLGFDGVVMTDSGAYQILEYGGVEASQREIIEYEKAIDSDIAVILDIPTGDVDRVRAEASVRETLARAREALALIDPENRFWVLPVQGGRHLDLVDLSAREAASLPKYNMYGIGSPTVFLEKYMYDIVVAIVATAKRRLRGGLPVHLFGAGHPLIIPFAVALGVDTFDSASYILYARDGRYMTEWGVYRLDELEYFPCSCPVCSRYTPRELREMPREERTRLLALHNLYVIRRSVERVKQAIREGRLWEHLEETASRHFSSKNALRELIFRGSTLLELSAPRVKGVVKGVRALSRESMFNPRLARFRDSATARLLELVPQGVRVELKPLLGRPDPARCRPREESYTVYYQPYTGLVPEDLCGVYPTVQMDYPARLLEREVVEDLAARLLYAYETLKARGQEVTVSYCRDAPWSVEAVEIAGLRGSEDCEAPGLKPGFKGGEGRGG